MSLPVETVPVPLPPGWRYLVDEDADRVGAIGPPPRAAASFAKQIAFSGEPLSDDTAARIAATVWAAWYRLGGGD